MTIDVQTPTVEYTGDGFQTLFTYTFTVDLGSELVVKVDDTEQVEFSDYIIQNVTPAGGEVLFTVPPADQTKIRIFRRTPLEQQVDYEPFEAFPADTLEWSLDRIIRIIQEFHAGVQDGGTGSPNLVMSVFGRIGHILAVAGDYTAALIDYVNTFSGLVATNVQDAIDELKSNSDAHEGDHNNPHVVTHAQVYAQDGTEDDHHPKLHDLESHTDVDLTLNVLEQGQGIWWDSVSGSWRNRAVAAESWPTGLVNGGELNTGILPTDIEVVAGLGAVIDSYTNPLAPSTIIALTWDLLNEPITAAPSVAGSVVWFTIGNTGIPAVPPEIGGVLVFEGEVKQYAQPLTPQLQRSEVFLGVAVHNGAEWDEISNPKVINQTAETLREYLINVTGPSWIISGGTVLQQAGFTLDQEEGVIWENNRNWHVDKSDPNRETLPAALPINFQYVNQDFTDVEALSTVVDPTQWDDAGTVIPVGGPANNSTIQRVYIDPANNYWILWGQHVYQNFLTAQANLPAEQIVVPFILQNSVLLGYIISTRSDVDWDDNSAIFVAASAGAGSGGGGTPITDHDNLNGITSDNHHNQIHLLFGADHSDVDLGTAPVLRDGLYWNSVSSKWEVDRRTRYIPEGFVNGETYQRGDEVSNGSQISEALIDGATEPPFIEPTGEPATAYQAFLSTVQNSAKQILFGNRYTLTSSGYLVGARIDTTVGNNYQLFSIRDPLGAAIIKEIAAFTGTVDGWFDIAIPETIGLAGAVFDLIGLVSEPDPVPVTFTGTWNYTTPPQSGIPPEGDVIHSNILPSIMQISATDQTGPSLNRYAELAGLDIGDIIELLGIRYSIQSSTDNTTYFNFTIAPAVQAAPDGNTLFTFETTAPALLTTGFDTDYWLTTPPPFATVQGLFGIDTAYPDVIPNNTAYGTDILFQNAYVPTEWQVKVLSEGTGGGGGAFIPDLFEGAGTTGYVPDPISEQGYILQDDGLWYPQRWILAGDDVYNNNVGNVGIGLTDPVEKLEVAGNIYTRGGNLAASNALPVISLIDNDAVLPEDVSGVIRWADKDNLSHMDLFFNSGLMQFNNDVTGIGGFRWNAPDQPQAMTMNNVGLLGINKATPEVRLDIRLNDLVLARTWTPSADTGLIVQGNQWTYVDIIAGSGQSSAIRFGHETTQVKGQMIYNHPNSELRLLNGAVNSLKLYASGAAGFNNAADAAGAGSVNTTGGYYVNGVESVPNEAARLSLAVAPANNTDAGVTGEIRFNSFFIYMCIGTNAWKRVSITNW